MNKNSKMLWLPKNLITLIISFWSPLFSSSTFGWKILEDLAGLVIKGA